MFQRWVVEDTNVSPLCVVFVSFVCLFHRLSTAVGEGDGFGFLFNLEGVEILVEFVCEIYEVFYEVFKERASVFRNNLAEGSLCVEEVGEVVAERDWAEDFVFFVVKVESGFWKDDVEKVS